MSHLLHPYISDLKQISGNKTHSQENLAQRVNNVASWILDRGNGTGLNTVSFTPFGFDVVAPSGDMVATLSVRPAVSFLESIDTVTGDGAQLYAQLGGSTFMRSQMGAEFGEVGTTGLTGKVSFLSSTGLYGYGDGLGAYLPVASATPDFILSMMAANGEIRSTTPAEVLALIGGNFVTANLTLTDPTRTHSLGTNDLIIGGIEGSSWFFTLTDAATTTTTSYELSASPTGAPVRNIREASRILGVSGRSYQRFVQPGYEQKLITGTVSGFSLTEIIDQSSVVTPYSFAVNQTAGSIDYSFSVATTQTDELWLVNSNQLQKTFDGTLLTEFTLSGGERYEHFVDTGGVSFTYEGLAEVAFVDIGSDGTIILSSTTGAYNLAVIPPTIAAGEDFLFRDVVSGDIMVNDFVDTAVKLQNAIVEAREVVNIDNTDSPYSTVAGDEIILADTTGGAIIVNLPTAASAILTGKSRVITIMVTSSTAANTLTIEPDGAELIQDKGAALAANIVSNAAGDIGKSWTVVSDGTNWYVI